MAHRVLEICDFQRSSVFESIMEPVVWSCAKIIGSVFQRPGGRFSLQANLQTPLNCQKWRLKPDLEPLVARWLFGTLMQI